jgi:membrane protease subunit (stomatin/prohibitin family)
VYFVSTRQWTDQKWGTQNPVMVRDPEFGPVRLRAFGSYAFKVSDPATFLKQLVSTDPSFETYEVTNQLRNTIVSRFIDVLGLLAEDEDRAGEPCVAQCSATWKSAVAFRSCRSFF